MAYTKEERDEDMEQERIEDNENKTYDELEME